MEFRILGPLETTGADGEPVEVRSAIQRAILVHLLIHRDTVVSPERLLEDVWEDDQPGGGVKTVRFHLSKLRDALSPGRDRGSVDDCIETTPHGYVIRSTTATVDLHRFEAEITAATALVDTDPEAARDNLAAALEMWHPNALADVVDLTFGQREHERLTEVRVAALEERIDLDLQLGSTNLLVAELEALVEEHPLRERLWGQLMLALYRSDRQAEALRVYQRAHKVLAEELGLEPSPALRRLEAQMLERDVELDTPDTVETTTPAGNIPDALDAFIGRERDVQTLEALLPHNQLITVTGVGGVGKTRLTTHIARRAGHAFRDGAWLVEFGPVTDPDAVVDAVTTALDVRPDYGTEPLTALVDEIRDREAIVVLDNCEHVIDAAAEVALAVLRSCPGVKLLATSREPLRIPGETVWTLDPMSVGAGDAGEPTDSVALFCDRARLIDPTFRYNDDNATAIASICERLDGLPLAIELAAAALRALSIDDIADGLQHRFSVLSSGSRSALAHQRTIEATVAWSFDLLEPDEQMMFLALGVFANQFDRRGAEHVAAGAGIEPHAVLGHLVTLVEKSLIGVVKTNGDIHYRMLSTVHDYARLRLAGHPEARAIADAHTNWVMGVVEVSHARIFDGDMTNQVAKVHRIRDDVELVLERSRRQGAPDTGLRLLALLEPYLVEAGDHGGFLSRSAVRAGASWVDRLLGSGDVSDEALAPVLSAQGFLLILENRIDAATPVLERALELCLAAGDEAGTARTQLYLSMALWSS